MSLVRGWTLTRAWDAGRAGTLTLAIKQAWVGRAGNSMQRDMETDDQMDRKRPFLVYEPSRKLETGRMGSKFTNAWDVHDL